MKQVGEHWKTLEEERYNTNLLDEIFSKISFSIWKINKDNVNFFQFSNKVNENNRRKISCLFDFFIIEFLLRLSYWVISDLPR